MLDRYLAALPAMSLIPFAPFFTADFLAAFFALLLPPRPRRLVIGHVLLRGHARNGAADRFSKTAAPASLDQLATARGLPP